MSPPPPVFFLSFFFCGAARIRSARPISKAAVVDVFMKTAASLEFSVCFPPSLPATACGRSFMDLPVGPVHWPAQYVTWTSTGNPVPSLAPPSKPWSVGPSLGTRASLYARHGAPLQSTQGDSRDSSISHIWKQLHLKEMSCELSKSFRFVACSFLA